MSKYKANGVSVVMAMRDAETTVLYTLRSLRKQVYPINEIIVIDNVSSDDSILLVEQFRKANPDLSLHLIKHRANMGVEGSYNEGARLANSQYVVFIHSDSLLPTKFELTKLIEPLRHDPQVIYSIPRIALPLKVWLKFNFWQKCLLARSAGTEVHGLNGKFDAVRKKDYLAIGGANETIFGHNIGTGGGDADLNMRFRKLGVVANSGARLIHLHHLSQKYALADLVENRQLLARTHGRLLRVIGLPDAGPIFVIGKPLLVALSLIPQFFPLNMGILLLYAIFSMNIMYRTKSTLRDYRILFLPWISIFLLYYEVFWLVHGILFLPERKSVV